jgi:hypothetical protein
VNQRIDLYRDDLRPPESSGEFQRNLVLFALALLAMTVWAGVAQWRASTLTRQLEGLRVDNESLQAEMTSATAAIGQRQPDPQLTRTLVQAQFALDARRWLLEQLKQADASGPPVSAMLEGLGRQRPAPLWLTRIHVAEGGQALGLSGRTLDAAVLPAFLERLATEDALKGRHFTYFRMGRTEQAGEPLGFDMATGCVAMSGGCGGEQGAEASP